MSQSSPKLNSSDLNDFLTKEYKILLGLNVNKNTAEDSVIKFFESKNMTNNDWDLFWIVFADLQIKCGTLSDYIAKKALEVIDSGRELNNWGNLFEIEKYFNKMKWSFPQINMLCPKVKEDLSSITSQGLIDREEGNKNVNSLFNEPGIFEAVKEQYKIKNNIETPDVVLPNYVQDYLNNANTYSHIWAYKKSKNNYLKRKEILEELRERIVSYKPFSNKIPKPFTFSIEWTVGDVIAYKIENSDNMISSYNNKYILFRIVKINRIPVSKIITNLAYEDQVLISIYDYADYILPTKDQIKYIDYLPFESNFTKSRRQTMSVTVSFYGQLRDFKKMNYIKLFSDEDFINNAEDYIINASTLGSHLFITGLPAVVCNHHLRYYKSKENTIN